MVACAIVLVACGTGPVVPATVSAETQIADSVAGTLTAVAVLDPTATSTATKPPASPTSTVTPSPTARPTLPIPTAVAPVSTTFPDARYVLVEERPIGEFAIRIWRNEDSPSAGLGFDSLLTLEQTGSTPIQVEYFNLLGQLSGKDLTGDGIPELVVFSYTGGAHCCSGVTVYSLGETPTLILQTRPSNCGGVFNDLDGDGILEFITCDDLFAYTYCPYAALPLVRAILAYTPGAGYVAASPRFSDQYAADMATTTIKAEAAQPGALGEWDNTTKCGVLPLVLALLYSGQPDQAWTELARIYTYPDTTAFQQEIEQTVGTSPLFTLP